MQIIRQVDDSNMNIYKLTLILHIIALIFYWVNSELFIKLVQTYGNEIGIFLIIYFFIVMTKFFSDLSDYARGDDDL